MVSLWCKRFFYQRLAGLEEPPEVVMQVKALACELLATRGLPLSRLSCADIAREAQRRTLSPW